MKTLIVFSTPRCALLCSQPQSGMKKCFITSRYWNHRLFFSIITVDYSFKPYIICLKLSQPLPTCTKVSSYSKWPTCTKVSSYNYFLFQCLYNIIEYTVNFCVVPGHYFGFYKMCIISMSEIVYISNHILSGLPTTGCEPGLVIGLGIGIVVAYLIGAGTTAAFFMCYYHVTRSPDLWSLYPVLPHNWLVYPLQESKRSTLTTGTLSLNQMMHMYKIPSELSTIWTHGQHTSSPVPSPRGEDLHIKYEPINKADSINN